MTCLFELLDIIDLLHTHIITYFRQVKTRNIASERVLQSEM